MNLCEVVVRRVRRLEEHRFQELMDEHHYLGCVPKISETLWYVAVWRDQWVALVGFSAAAWKCAARDVWIGWSLRHQYDRLKLVVNNNRFLILPECHLPNLGSRILSLCQKRLSNDWQGTFGHPVVLLETFVDPRKFRGTLYKAANWVYVGDTKGFRRTGKGYTVQPQSPKMVFVKPLHPNARGVLSRPILKPPYCTGGAKMMLPAEHMR
ncbi:MAG: Druantia anti-phage system protein DruA, partial [Desulfoferrobacter sp.]